VKNGAAVFLAVFIALGLSWCGFVLAPAHQLGGAKQTTILNSTELYPLGRPGEANQGLQIYRANGCAACHTEQIRQTGVTCNVVLTDAGKSPKAVSIQMAQMKLDDLSKEDADAASDKITAAGGKAEIHIVATGPDIDRAGWGMRQSVAEDYLYDYPVQLGSLRAGPDLANAGVHEPDLNWQLVHLYTPASEVKGSTMPPFRYLFEVRKIAETPSPDALVFPKGFEPPAGYEIVPKPEAQELAAYLLSLRANVPLHSAPYSQ
jgi:cytochrome c oxidase cbb3-type subunit 2